MGQRLRDGRMSRAAALMGASPTPPSKDAAEKTQFLACPSCFTLIPYCLWPPAFVISTSHTGPKPPQVSLPMCTASLLQIGVLRSPLPWPLLPENGVQVGKSPKSSLRRDLAELEAKVKEALA